MVSLSGQLGQFQKWIIDFTRFMGSFILLNKFERIEFNNEQIEIDWIQHQNLTCVSFKTKCLSSILKGIDVKKFIIHHHRLKFNE